MLALCRVSHCLILESRFMKIVKASNAACFSFHFYLINKSAFGPFCSTWSYSNTFCYYAYVIISFGAMTHMISIVYFSLGILASKAYVLCLVPSFNSPNSFVGLLLITYCNRFSLKIELKMS